MCCPGKADGEAQSDPGRKIIEIRRSTMVTVLKGGTLIDGTGSDPISPAVLVMDGEQIAGVGREGEVDIPGGAEVIDITGKAMLPGLVNCHTHLCFDAIHDLKEQALYDSPMIVALKVAMNLRQCLQAGVTAVRDLGVRHGATFAAAQALQGGIIPGPRLFYCGSLIAITGGHAFWMSHEVDGVDAVRQAVREELKFGASWIKMMASGSRQEALTRTGSVWTQAFPEFTVEELKAAAEEAHTVGRKITAHATEAQAIRNCLEAGFDCLEHGGPFGDEMLETMIKNDVWVVPTLSGAYLQVERGAEIGMPEAEIEQRRQALVGGNKRAEQIMMAAKAGVRMAMGTDAGSPAVPNNEVVREMELLHELGICKSPMDVIVMATRNGAELLGIGEELGTLEEGKVADILVVDGDPLAELGALRNVHLVFLGGKLMVRKEAQLCFLS